MKANLLVGVGLAASLGLCGTAWGQRSEENVVTSAQDAFGTSVGNERVGLYRPAWRAASARSKRATFESTASM